MAGDRREDAEEARANATATPAPPVDSLRDCPWGDASCVLALGIERALQANNVDAVIEFMATRLFICPGGRPEGPGQPFPLCAGAEKDTGRTGLPFGRRYSEGGVQSVDGIRSMVQGFLDDIDANAKDAVGDGRLRLYAFSCSTPAIRFQNVSCAREAIILSAIIGDGSSQRRELLISGPPAASRDGRCRWSRSGTAPSSPTRCLSSSRRAASCLTSARSTPSTRPCVREVGAAALG